MTVGECSRDKQIASYLGAFRKLTSALVFMSGMVQWGCSTPDMGGSKTIELPPDGDDGVGGSFIESRDIRSIAVQMTPAILSVPEIEEAGHGVGIAIAPFRNSSRYAIDNNIFMQRLRIELSKVADGRVRFFSQHSGQAERMEILAARQEPTMEEMVEDAVDAILAAPVIRDASRALRMAPLPFKNTNLQGVNANSFSALLGARLAERAGGKIETLSREASGKIAKQIIEERKARNSGKREVGSTARVWEVDYFIGGEFVADSIMPEAATDDTTLRLGRSPDDPRAVGGGVRSRHAPPNTGKFIIVKLIDAQTTQMPFQKTLRIDKKITSGLENAAFILTGELSSLSKMALGGDRSDYVIVSFQLVDAGSNEIVWEDAYETKKKTSVSVIYK